MRPANQQPQTKKSQIKEEPRAVKDKTQDQAAAEKPGTRKESVYFGIPGAQPLSRIERTVPADEPPALAPNDQLKHIGKRVPRQDGRFKTTGAAKYPSDMHLPNMLYGKFLSSTVPHARVSSVDTSAADKYPGVKAVHVIENDLLSAQVLDKTKELQSKYPVVRYSGQPIAALNDDGQRHVFAA